MARTSNYRRSKARSAGRVLVLVSVVLVGMAILAPTAQAQAVLSVDKTADPAEDGTVVPGETITYTVVVANGGTDTATNVTLSDPTPTDTTYVPGSATLNGSPVADEPGPPDPNPFGQDAGPDSLPDLPAGSSHTVTFQVIVDSPLDNGTTITNTATADADNANPSADDAVHTVAWLTLTKTASPAGDTEVNPGTTISYTIDVENSSAGSDAATNVTLTDATPANTTYVADSATVNGIVQPGETNPFESGYLLDAALGPGESHTVTFEVKVNVPTADGADITNTAVLSSNQPDLTAEVTHTVDAAVALEVTASADPAPGATVAAGDTITYTATVSNNAAATDSARGVVYKDPTPEGTTYVDGSSTLDGAAVPDASNPFEVGYSLGDIAPGISKTLSYKVTVNSGAGAIARTVTVTATNAAAAVTATTAHTGPGAEAAQPARGSRGSGGSRSGGGGGTGGAGSSVGGAGTSGDGENLAFTGLETMPLTLLALSLLLAGWTLIMRGRSVERRAVTVWDEARVRASRLMTRDPSVGPWFFSARRR